MKHRLHRFQTQITQITFLATCYLLLATLCFAQPLSSSELINNAKQYDGRVVAYEGEVIGDIMARGDYAWINVNDSQNAIGIWIDKGLTKDILYTGSYKFKGDWIEVTGVFNRACAQHGGDLDIHGQNIRKISPGRPILEKLNLSKRNMALFLSGILLAVLILIWISRLLKQK